MLYPTAVNGRVWESKWDNGIARNFGDITPKRNDPSDPEFITEKLDPTTGALIGGLGNGQYKTDGQGVLMITGPAPRMYVARFDRDWHHYEATLYGMRMADSNLPYGGLEIVGRSNHDFLNDEDIQPCDNRGFSGSFDYAGEVRIEKETCHHCDQIPGHDGYAQNAKQLYSNGMPKNVWIGIKVVVRDVIRQSDGAVVGVNMQIWRDQSDGFAGGNWVKVHDVTDNGTNFLWSDSANNTGVLVDPCKVGVDPGLMLTASNSRPGSETGRPNISIYFRSDGISTDGLWYKKASIREIDPIAV